MSQHRQATDPGPSRISVVTTFLMALGAATETIWILAGPGDDPRHLAGGVMGFTVAVLLVAHWARQMGHRETVRRRVGLERRAADRRAAQAAWVAAMSAVSEPEPDPVATQPVPVSASEPDPLDLTRPYVPVLRPEDAATEVLPKVVAS